MLYILIGTQAVLIALVFLFLLRVLKLQKLVWRIASSGGGVGQEGAGSPTRQLIPDEEPEHWINAAKKDTENQIPILETGLRRHPGSKKLLQRLADVLWKAGELDPDPVVQREIVIRLLDYTGKFQECCPSGDVRFGVNLRKNIDQKADEVIGEILERQRDKMKYQLDALERRAKILLKKEKLSQEENDELARMDDMIDKSLLQSHGELKTRYDELARQIVEYFTKADRALMEQQNLKYNENALSAAGKALDLFVEHEGEFKKSKRSSKALADLLGGWDPRFLVLSTATYVSSVYSEIFQKMKPDARMEIAEYMLKTKSREP